VQTIHQYKRFQYSRILITQYQHKHTYINLIIILFINNHVQLQKVHTC